MIDISNDSWSPPGIRVYHYGNTFKHRIPKSCIHSERELVHTVRTNRNIPANNEVEKRLGLLERMETCLTWTQLVFHRVSQSHSREDWHYTLTVNERDGCEDLLLSRSQSLSITSTSLAWYSSSLRNTPENVTSVSSHGVIFTHEEPFPQIHTVCWYHTKYWQLNHYKKLHNSSEVRWQICVRKRVECSACSFEWQQKGVKAQH